MSALTKLFVVLLVVLSLMLSAGMIVFVNRTENFKATEAAEKQAVAQANIEASTAKAQSNFLSGQIETLRGERDMAIASSKKDLDDKDSAISGLKGQIATLEGNIKMGAVTSDNLTAALTASEAQRTALTTALTSTRADYDKSVTQVSDLNKAISDLTNRLEVSTSKMTNYQEQLAEQRSEVDRLSKLVVDLGGNVHAPGGLAAGAPSINAVIVSTTTQNGIPLATISVGSNDQVKTGMKFSVIDSQAGQFLGELTVETVDQQSSTGKLEGPKVTSIHAGNEAKTQL